MTIDIRAESDREAAAAALGRPLSFGRELADLMFLAHHTRERGWHDAAIVPYGPLPLMPAAKVLHYALEVFEGHKAYRWPDGRVALFRPELNAERLNRSAHRLRLAEVPVELQREATDRLVDRVREWVPGVPGSSLYLRPAIIGTEPALGIAASASHLYFIIASPVGPYFPKGFASVSIKVEEHAVRAAPGGVGAAKTGGNYAAALDAHESALAEGFGGVLLLDAVEHRFLEELSGMNVMAVVDDKLVTPPLTGTILPGITRRTLLELAPELGIEAVERPMAIDEVIDRIRAGRVSEMMAVGTAAVITPIGSLGYQSRVTTIGNGEPGTVTRTLYKAITDVQYGRAEDRYDWMRVVDPIGEEGLAA